MYLAPVAGRGKQNFKSHWLLSYPERVLHNQLIYINMYVYIYICTYTHIYIHTYQYKMLHSLMFNQNIISTYVQNLYIINI